MKNLKTPIGWILLELVLDSFVYNQNRLQLWEITDYVQKRLAEYQRIDLFDYDRVVQVVSSLEDSKVIDSIYSSDGDFFTYFRNDLKNCPKFNY